MLEQEHLVLSFKSKWYESLLPKSKEKQASCKLGQTKSCIKGGGHDLLAGCDQIRREICLVAAAYVEWNFFVRYLGEVRAPQMLDNPFD